MIKSIETSSIKKLSKKDQKAIVGGACPGGGYPIQCGRVKKCPEYCNI